MYFGSVSLFTAWWGNVWIFRFPGLKLKVRKVRGFPYRGGAERCIMCEVKERMGKIGMGKMVFACMVGWM